MAGLGPQLTGLRERLMVVLAERLERNLRAKYAEIVPRGPTPTANFTDRVPPGSPGKLADALVLKPFEDGTVGFELSIDNEIAPHWAWIDEPPAIIEPSNKWLAWMDGFHGLTVRRYVTPSTIHEGWWSEGFIGRDLPEIIHELTGQE